MKIKYLAVMMVFSTSIVNNTDRVSDFKKGLSTIKIYTNGKRKR